MPRNSTSVSTKQERIAALAKQAPSMAFTSLAYLMDMDWLTEAYRRTRKDGAAGVDGVTADEYQQNLEGNLAPAGPRQIRHLPRSSCAAGAYSQGQLRYGDAPHRNPDPGGQGSPAGGRHAAGTDLRTGLHGLLVRLPAGAIGASSVGRFSRPIDDQSGWLCLG